jgi:putative transposase
MARLARVVVPGVPHHVTQRGNRRMPVFFSDTDYAVYIDLLKEGCERAKVGLWAYCLMPNHVHLILTPSDEGGLRGALGEAHRRYARRINQREGWTGFLFQGRFASVPMDDRHLLACARYVELNPVRARLVAEPQDWAWSSARAHLSGRSNGVVDVRPLLERCTDWNDLLESGLSDEEHAAIRKGERTGRPLGSPEFVAQLERNLGRSLLKRKPGPRTA